MSSKLTKALEFANYRTTLNIQHNNLKAKVQSISEDKFLELAEDAKQNCPISGALNCDIILNASLV